MSNLTKNINDLVPNAFSGYFSASEINNVLKLLETRRRVQIVFS